MVQFQPDKASSPKLFNAIAGRYDLLNRILSFGMDVSWRKRISRHLPAGEALKVLDLATGTADVPICLVTACPRVASVKGIDLAEEMLRIGRRKVERAGLLSRITLQLGDAQQVPFPDRSFDVVTVAFGLRNMPRLMAALAEAFRVLKPGGRLIVLEFSPSGRGLAGLGQGLYVRFGVPVLGFLLTGHAAAYAYLGRTVMDFPSGERFGRIIRQVGFRTVKRDELCLGAATIYTADV